MLKGTPYKCLCVYVYMYMRICKKVTCNQRDIAVQNIHVYATDIM